MIFVGFIATGKGRTSSFQMASIKNSESSRGENTIFILGVRVKLNTNAAVDQKK